MIFCRVLCEFFSSEFQRNVHAVLCHSFVEFASCITLYSIYKDGYRNVPQVHAILDLLLHSFSDSHPYESIRTKLQFSKACPVESLQHCLVVRMLIFEKVFQWAVVSDTDNFVRVATRLRRSFLKDGCWSLDCRPNAVSHDMYLQYACRQPLLARNIRNHKHLDNVNFKVISGN